MSSSGGLTRSSDIPDEGPFFYLLPKNRAAQKVVEDPLNANYQEELNGGLALRLHFPDPKNPRITMGTARCDVTLPPGAGLDRHQCQFDYFPTTGAVVLTDKSDKHTTQVYDGDQEFVVPLSQIVHSVIISRGFNRLLLLGKKPLEFAMKWPPGSDRVQQFLSKFPNEFGPERDDPTPEKVRYVKGEMLGSGVNGFVWKTVDVRTGKAMAVKRFQDMDNVKVVYAIREVNIMLRLSGNRDKQIHEHIIPILDVVYDKAHHSWIELFMPLREGCVMKLIRDENRFMEDAQLGDEVLYQMALALKYVQEHNMIHRDIKPHNILYRVEYRVNEDGQEIPYYHFELCDFGLAQDAAFARSMVGTQTFMAPEIANPEEHRERQSYKCDIWSLFVTIVWIRNTENFRMLRLSNAGRLYSTILQIAEYPEYANIKSMACWRPKDRISAARLVDLLDGDEEVQDDGSKESKKGKRSKKSRKAGSSKEDASSAMLGGMARVSLHGEDVESEANYIHSISSTEKLQFERSHMYTNPSMGRHASMPGHSVMEEFGITPQTIGLVSDGDYQPGKIGRTYVATKEDPRNSNFPAECSNIADDFSDNDDSINSKKKDKGKSKGKGRGKGFLFG